MEQIRYELKLIDWESQLNGGINESWTIFKTTVDDIFNRNVPLKPKHNSKSKKLWITRSIIRASRKKKRLWRKFRETHELSTYSKYKASEQNVKLMLKELLVILSRKSWTISNLIRNRFTK